MAGLRLSRIGQWLAAAMLFFGVMGSAQAEVKTWDFRVYLDSREIGYHRFALSPSHHGERLDIQAQFKVRFMFFTAYRYAHSATEHWQQGCLSTIESRTDDNGEQYELTAASADARMQVEVNGEPNSISGCVRSFAYWNPELLNSGRLLNSQTGQYEAVQLEDRGVMSVDLNGKTVSARQRALQVDGKEIQLWYDQDDEWIALRTEVKGGRMLSYYRQNVGLL